MNEIKVKGGVEGKNDRKNFVKEYPSLSAVLNGLAAGMTNVLIQPFAVMRTTIQSMNIYTHGIGPNRSKILEILKSFRAGGIRTMYRGCTSSVCISASGWLIFRFLYDKFAHYEFFKDNRLSVNLARSASSSLITSVILHPFWNARLAIELQSRQTGIDGWPQYRGALNYLIRTLYQKNGIRATFRGLSVSLSSVSHHTLLIVIYDKLSQRKLINVDNQVFDKVNIFLNGMISRMIPTLVCYPLYVSRVMQQCHNTEIRSFSIFRIFLWNFKHNNLKGMYSGLPVQVVKSMLSGGIMFSLYEILVRISNRVLLML
ncbi:mitochondrial carrier protein, putative [Theileria annulata]|uniref:Mitochondrial carrier protein, putative n=1 Tax=Theileria annulata TaxID=5874 RepID=Q4U990_THEAN|nr:mitochondrial carrier protein, putative [Theileria annulata]CAI76613.1 mitochondrial carrier protein, putative [Theileria annulata]|eukprot:XP_953238.1 mitochondrial carrier protein, putative [Theileria annulata]